MGSKLKRKRTRRNLAFALKILPRFNSWQVVFTIATKAKEVKISFNSPSKPSPNFYELWNTIFHWTIISVKAYIDVHLGLSGQACVSIRNPFITVNVSDVRSTLFVSKAVKRTMHYYVVKAGVAFSAAAKVHIPSITARSGTQKQKLT